MHSCYAHIGHVLLPALGRMPRIAFNPETMFVGFGFFAVAGAIVFTRKKRDESEKQG
jgi:hypothetical protein